MGMTMTQKILAAHCGEAAVTAGQLINAKLDIVLGNDITTPVAINEFEKAGFDGESTAPLLTRMFLSAPFFRKVIRIIFATGKTPQATLLDC